jgi:hypothetical protein
MLSIYLSDDIILFILNEFNSCFNFLSYLNADIVLFSKKHSQKVKIDFCERFMINAVSQLLSSQYTEFE